MTTVPVEGARTVSDHRSDRIGKEPFMKNRPGNERGVRRIAHQIERELEEIRNSNTEEAFRKPTQRTELEMADEPTRGSHHGHRGQSV